MVDFLVDNPDTFTIIQVFTVLIAMIIAVGIGVIGIAVAAFSPHNSFRLFPFGLVALILSLTAAFFPNANIVGNPELDRLLEKERSCRENKEVLLSTGQDVAGLQCSNEYTVKKAQYECRKARMEMSDNSKDVSDIKCDVASYRG